MRYCKNCRILYSSQAAACPKCGVAEPPKKDNEGEEKPADGRAVKRDWLFLIIGTPLFILFVYLIVLLIKSIG